MGVKFNAPNVLGQQVVVPTPTKDAMLAVLSNPQATQTKKDLATEILNWYSAQTAKLPLTGNSELDRAAQLMLTEYHAKSLWDGSYRLEKQPINGREKKVVVFAKTGEPVLAAA
jgi:hypothetical protein